MSHPTIRGALAAAPAPQARGNWDEESNSQSPLALSGLPRKREPGYRVSSRRGSLSAPGALVNYGNERNTHEHKSPHVSHVRCRPSRRIFPASRARQTRSAFRTLPGLVLTRPRPLAKSGWFRSASAARSAASGWWPTIRFWTTSTAPAMHRCRPERCFDTSKRGSNLPACP